MPSYLAPDFDPDVFVSYSHGDPRGSRGPLRVWTETTIRRLGDHIHSLEPELTNLHLWMDTELDPTAKLTEELRKKVSHSGVLMIVMSKHYLESDWCKDELGWFKEEVQNRRVKEKRVFIIRAQETDTSLWPAFLRDERGEGIPGFVFYDSEDSSSPLSFDLKEPGEDYLRALNPLRTWLVRRLRELRSAIAKRLEPEKSAASVQPAREERRIYLYAHPDDDSKRIDVARALYEKGIVPLTSTHPGGRGGLPDWLSEDNGRLNEARTCEALALLRAVGGDRFRDDLLYVGVTERERIAGARGAPLPCAVLDNTGESLPIDVAPFGIKRFDVNETGWRDRFRSWLDESRAGPTRAVQ